MISYSSKRYFRLALLACLTLSGLINSLEKKVFAQITSDGTLPNNSSVSTDGNKFNINDGTRAGSNLFHSFQEFSVPTGSEAYFNNTVDIQNIITRVTGKSISDIDGLIKANGAANLFLINPMGIVFGENARLDIGGSFVGSTARGLKFASGIEFNADAAQNKPLLSVNVPLGLQYGNNSGDIINQSQAKNSRGQTVGLRVKPGKTLALVGGDVTLEGGYLSVTGKRRGRIEIGSVAEQSLVSLNPTDNGWELGYEGVESFKNIELSQQAVVNASGQGSGDIQVRGKYIKLTGGSEIQARTLGSKPGRNLTITASEAVELIGTSASGKRSRLITTTKGDGHAGDMTINTGKLLILNGGSIDTGSGKNLGGRAGNVTINASETVELIGTSASGELRSRLITTTKNDKSAGALNITTKKLIVLDGGSINTSSGKDSGGRAGNVTINASEAVELIGTSASGKSRSSLITTTKGDGHAGDMTINTGKLLILNGGSINTGSGEDSGGRAGSVSINASEAVELIGTSASGELRSQLTTEASGDGESAGNISIETKRLSIKNGALIATRSRLPFSNTAAGNVTINASESVEVSGETQINNENLSSRLATQTLGNGRAGNVQISTENLIINDGGVIEASTGKRSGGAGGNLTITAPEVVKLIGTSASGKSRSRLRTESRGNGDAGNIDIKTKRLIVQDGALISTGASLNNGIRERPPKEGRGGNLTIHASESVKLTGETLIEKDYQSRLTTQTAGNGAAGNLKIDTGKLVLNNGAQISGGTFTNTKGEGGNLTINADSIEVIGASEYDGGNGKQVSRITNQTVGDGSANNLSINTQKLIVRDGGLISASALSRSGPKKLSLGSGGTLDITASDLVKVSGGTKDSTGYRNSALTTLTEGAGNGGDLILTTDKLIIEDGGQVSAETKYLGTGMAGNLIIDADSILLNNDAKLTADTRSANVDPNREQATININSQDLIMRRGSNITTKARNENVVGGNINIDSGIIVAIPNENSNISADSANFRGGNVRIETQGIFGTQFRPEPTDKSDITATGATQNLSGTVEINEPEIDRSNAEELPTDVVDVSGLIEQNLCEASQDSEFIITGRGGIPTSPTEALEADAGWEDWRILPRNRSNMQQRVRKTKPKVDNREANQKNRPLKIVEAQGWVVDVNGDIIFTAHPPSANPHTSALIDLNCHSFSN